LLPDVHQRSGDFGVAVVIAAEWAVAMQQDQAVTGDRRSSSSSRAAFTGSWAGDVVAGRAQPGREPAHAVGRRPRRGHQSFLIFRDSDKIFGGTGATAFENVDAFRTGFFQGEQACVSMVPGS